MEQATLTLLASLLALCWIFHFINRRWINLPTLDYNVLALIMIGVIGTCLYYLFSPPIDHEPLNAACSMEKHRHISQMYPYLFPILSVISLLLLSKHLTFFSGLFTTTINFPFAAGAYLSEAKCENINLSEYGINETFLNILISTIQLLTQPLYALLFLLAWLLYFGLHIQQNKRYWLINIALYLQILFLIYLAVRHWGNVLKT